MKNGWLCLALSLVSLATAASAQTPTSFGPDQKEGERDYGVGYDGRSEWFADVNGDHLADHVYNKDGTRDLMVMASMGSHFGFDQKWGERTYSVGYSGHSEWLADVNGDGRIDYIYNRDGTRELRVLLSTTFNCFDTDQKWGERTYGVGYDGGSEWFTDVNGDGKADYVYNKDGAGELHVLLSTGTGFGADQTWGSRRYGVGYNGHSEWLEDVNGDGKADYVYNRDGNRDLQVMLSSGTAFSPDQKWGERNYSVGYDGDAEWFADVNGDGKADYLYNRNDTRDLQVMLGTDNGFGSDRKWGTRLYPVGRSGKSEWFKDVDGDGKADHLYGHDGTRDLQVMLSTGASFGSESTWGTRNYGVGYSGLSEWIVDLNGDQAADHVYNRDGTRELWVMTAGN